MFKHLDLLLVQPKDTIAEVMQSINRTAIWTDGYGIALIVDSTRHLLGVITDGDIRRVLLKDATLKTPVGEVMNCDPVVVRQGSNTHLLLRMFDKGIRQLPILDEQGRVVDLLQYSQFSVAPSDKRTLYRAKVPVRISFAGGGTDLTHFFEKEGGAVISTTIDQYCHALLIKRDDHKIKLHSVDFKQDVHIDSLDNIKYDGKLDLFKSAIRVVRPEFGFELYTYSDVPPGSGLGASSSMVVAIIGLLYKLSEGQLDAYRIADLAYQAERVELGMHGGWQDQYAAAFGGLNHIEFDTHDVTVHPLRLSEHIVYELESNLLLCFTGQTRDSGEIHAAQKENNGQKNSSVNSELNNEMLRLVMATKKSLLKGDLLEFGKLLDVAWQTKKNFTQGVSNERVEHLYSVAKAHGAVGGKLLGAGNGGFLLFYCLPLQRYRVKMALQNEDTTTMTFKFDNHGVYVWHSPHQPEQLLEMEDMCKP